MALKGGSFKLLVAGQEVDFGITGVDMAYEENPPRAVCDAIAGGTKAEGSFEVSKEDANALRAYFEANGLLPEEPTFTETRKYADGIEVQRTLTVADVRRMVETLRAANLPTFDGGYYHYVVSPTEMYRLRVWAGEYAVIYQLEQILRGRVKTTKKVHRARLRAALNVREKNRMTLQQRENATRTMVAWLRQLGAPIDDMETVSGMTVREVLGDGLEG